MNRKSVLVLNFDAPLQAYGRDSKWDTRDSGYYPSKSSVIGLIACAMGISRDSEKIDDLASKLTIHVRIDKYGKKYEDLQTVNWAVGEASGGIKKNKDGSNFHPLLKKSYLQDAIFTVFVCGDIDSLNEIHSAFYDPKWQLFFGRKCCVPSVPISTVKPFENVEDEEIFIKEYPISCIDRLNLKGEIGSYTVKYILDSMDGNIIENDVPTCKGQKYYGSRMVKEKVFRKEYKKVDGKYVFE